MNWCLEHPSLLYGILDEKSWFTHRSALSAHRVLLLSGVILWQCDS